MLEAVCAGPLTEEPLPRELAKPLLLFDVEQHCKRPAYHLVAAAISESVPGPPEARAKEDYNGLSSGTPQPQAPDRIWRSRL